jgi:hypothetical protein
MPSSSSGDLTIEDMETEYRAWQSIREIGCRAQIREEQHLFTCIALNSEISATRSVILRSY